MKQTNRGILFSYCIMVNKSGQCEEMVSSPVALSKTCLIFLDDFKFIYYFPESIIISMPTRIFPSMLSSVIPL